VELVVWGRSVRSTVLLGLGLLACRPVLAPTVPAPRAEPAEAWDAVLREVVTADGLVDYDLLEARREALDQYVAWIARPRPPAPRDNPQHAFWLNAYNALVLFAVLEDDCPASVKDVAGWLPMGGSGFFFERAFLVEGRPTSLFEIEHEHLRGTVMDVRDHAALNCASRGCPPLRNETYRSRQLDQQLREQMGRWVDDDARGVRIEAGQAVFSPIFDWYAHDFALFTGEGDLCTTAARFASPPKAERLRELAAEGCPHRFSDYDWSLNDASATR
jgi:hypothetical protein